MQGRLDVGAVIRKVWRIYVDQAPVLMPAAAVVFVFTGVISTVLIKAGSGLALIAELVGLVATWLFTGMVVELVSDLQDGRRDATPAQLLRAVVPVLGSLILVAIVAGIAILVGFVLIIVPGLILLTIWSVAVPVVVLEKPPGLRALSRSRELVRGNGWQVFGVILVMYFLVLVVSVALQAAGNSAGTGVGIVVSVIVGVLTAPLPALALSVLYFELLSLRGERRPSGPPVEVAPAQPAADPFAGP
ncbi:MAG: hypothetical protein JWM60_715 [Solirubrobacterales bacterium]|jgi:hypothetical protein|nr:hypothetical protein [Solirubrobacterales bacterium]